MPESGGISEYLGVFLDEADEQVETLDHGLLQLEREPANDDLLQGIFRAAHSLKSSSAAMGFATMSRLTHAAENLLDQFRCGEAHPTTDVINHLLAAVDALKLMKQSIRDGSGDDLDVAEVLVALSEACCPSGPPEKTGDRPEGVEPYLEAADDLAGANARQVVVTLKLIPSATDAQIAKPGDAVVAAFFEVSAGPITGMASFCLPMVSLNLHQLPEGDTGSRARRSGAGTLPPGKRLMDILRGVRVTCSARLGEAPITAGGVAELQAGDLVLLDTSEEDPLTLYVGNDARFCCRPVSGGQRLAVEILGDVSKI